MHELFKCFKPQSLFSKAIIPYAAYTYGHRLWLRKCNGGSEGQQSINQYQYAVFLTRVIACMLQTFLDVAPIASCHACQFFFQGLALHFTFIYVINNTPLYGNVVHTYITNCYEFIITKFTFIKNQTFLWEFYATKIWSHTVYHNILLCQLCALEISVCKG